MNSVTQAPIAMWEQMEKHSPHRLLGPSWNKEPQTQLPVEFCFLPSVAATDPGSLSGDLVHAAPERGELSTH
eukprot:7576808-Pyramimonas_sp.AAC.1